MFFFIIKEIVVRVPLKYLSAQIVIKSGIKEVLCKKSSSKRYYYNPTHAYVSNSSEGNAVLADSNP